MRDPRGVMNARRLLREINLDFINSLHGRYKRVC